MARPESDPHSGIEEALRFRDSRLKQYMLSSDVSTVDLERMSAQLCDEPTPVTFFAAGDALMQVALYRNSIETVSAERRQSALDQAAGLWKSAEETLPAFIATRGQVSPAEATGFKMHVTRSLGYLPIYAIASRLLGGKTQWVSADEVAAARQQARLRLIGLANRFSADCANDVQRENMLGETVLGLALQSNTNFLTLPTPLRSANAYIRRNYTNSGYLALRLQPPHFKAGAYYSFNQPRELVRRNSRYAPIWHNRLLLRPEAPVFDTLEAFLDHDLQNRAVPGLDMLIQSVGQSVTELFERH